MWIRVGREGGGLPLWILIIFYDIVMKFADAHNWEGGNAYPQNADSISFFLNPAFTRLVIKVINWN